MGRGRRVGAAGCIKGVGIRNMVCCCIIGKARRRHCRCGVHRDCRRICKSRRSGGDCTQLRGGARCCLCNCSRFSYQVGHQENAHGNSNLPFRREGGSGFQAFVVVAFQCFFYVIHSPLREKLCKSSEFCKLGSQSNSFDDAYSQHYHVSPLSQCLDAFQFLCSGLGRHSLHE